MQTLLIQITDFHKSTLKTYKKKRIKKPTQPIKKEGKSYRRLMKTFGINYKIMYLNNKVITKMDGSGTYQSLISTRIG